MRRKTTEVCSIIVLALMQRPCSLKALTLDLGGSEDNAKTATKYVAAFHASGLVYISGWHRQRWPVYAWQPSKGYFADAKQPPLANPKKPSRAEQRAKPKPVAAPQPVYKPVPSVFALGGQA